MKRPPGFSPFRSALMEQTRGGTTVSVPHTLMTPIQDEEQDPEKEQGSTQGHGWHLEEQIRHSIDHDHKLEHDQGHGYKRGHGLGHGHKKQHGPGHGHQQELDYDLEPQGGHGPDHGHQGGRGLAHGRKPKHGHGHGKHKNKNKKHGKHLASSSEESPASAQTQEKTEGPAALVQADRAATFSNFEDLDLFEALMPNTAPAPTESADDWIPDVQIEPTILSFNLISDFPETTSPRCPGRPWKPVNGAGPSTETKEVHDFDLSEALN